MVVDIYLREKNGSREIRIPWLPEKIVRKSGGTVRASYDILDRGPVEIPTGSGLSVFSWESTFPGENRTDTSMLRGDWQNPADYDSILEDWRAKGTLLTILVTGYPINTDVYVDDYTSEATGGFGDIDYEVSFVEARDIVISSTTAQKRSTTTETKYTIKSGDTLWSIAQRFLGSGARWTEIYNANKEIIESTAKKRWSAVGINRDSQNGHWIFPGTVITIPGTGGSGSSKPTLSGTTKATKSSSTAPFNGKYASSNMFLNVDQKE